MTERAVNPVYEKLMAGGQAQAPIGSGEERDGARILTLPSRGSGRFFLRFVDTRHGEYAIPVGRMATRKRDEAPVHERNILVPILPRVYTTPDLDPAKCAVPRSGGWLYVFKGQYLWRELEVLPQGWMRDVNLHEYAGKDARTATVEKDQRLLLPYRLDGEEPEIRMAYSDVQWSWARINLLGGMDPNDFRLHPDHLPPMPEDLGYTEEQIAQAREARLQRIDLSGFDDGFPVQPPEGRTARIENVAHANAELLHIRLHHEANIPVVYLHDPLGVMLQNLEAYRRTEADLLAEVEKAKAHEHYRSAVLTWQTFFNEALWQKARHRHCRRAHYVDNSDEAYTLRRAAAEMDQELLKDILRIEPRRKLRRTLRTLRQRHFDWLEGRITREAQNGEAAEEKTIDEIAPDFVTFEAALLDYASLPRDGYIQLWSVMNLALLYANHDPSALDAGLDLERDREKPAPGADPGRRYLERLCQPDHPLHVMLFPTRDQVDETSPEAPADPALAADELPGPDGRFRPVAFAGALAGHVLGTEDLAIALAKEADKIVASFILQFQRQWQQAGKQAKTVVQEGLIRLVKATCHPELQGMHLVEPGTDLKGKVIIDGQVRILEKLAPSRVRDAFRAAVRNPGRERVNVIDPRTGKAVFSQAITDIADIRGLPPQADEKAWAELMRKVDADGVARARGRFVVVDEISPYALRYHRPTAPVGEDVKRAVRGLEVAGKAVPPLVLVVEMLNVAEMYSATSTETDNWKERATSVLAAFALVYIVVDTPLKVAGHEKGAKFWADIMPRERWRKPTTRFLTSTVKFKMMRGTVELRTVGLIGAGVSLAGAVMAGWDALDSLATGDDDAAAAHGIQALAGLALALCDVGAASTSATGLLAGFGPWGWAALAVFLAAGLVANMLRDTPLEKWGKHGPFAKDPAARGTHEYSRPVRDENGNVMFEGTGRNRHVVREPLPPEKMFEALMSLLMSPGIEVRLDRSTVPATVLVDVRAPGFEPGRSSLNVLVTGETAYRMSPRERAMALRNGYANIAAMERFTSSGIQQPLQLREWQPLLDEDGIRQTGIRYRYALPPLGGQGDYRITIRARGRHITAEQLVIPTLPGEEAPRPAEPDRVDPAIPGWVYAQQVVRPA